VSEQVDAPVCVVGAGYAGLTAARALAKAGARVVLLEARDRVGGRAWTQYLDDGTALDMGGTWLGPGQDAAYALAAELGVTTYPTYAAGDTVFVDAQGKRSVYGGAMPKIHPVAIASLAQAMLRLDAMARRVPIEAPWTAKRAASWDAQSIAAWLDWKVPTATAKRLLEAAVRGLMTADPSEVSLLDLLYLIRSAKGGLNALLAIEGGYQQDRMTGGAQRMADLMANDLGDALHLSAPVSSVDHDGATVTVRANGIDVRAQRLLITTPPSLASRIAFDPPLHGDRAQLLLRMPAGALIKTLVVYEDPFWRASGLSGQTVAMNSPIETTLDASPESGRPGILSCFAFGPLARNLARATAEDRRRITLDALRERFGDRALAPIGYFEHDWEREEWTRGCSMAHFAPGILTQYGEILRQPTGRIHWAGTETATVSHGTIDGAIRSGQRAAAEILAALD
jgi:monoamine oxidase